MAKKNIGATISLKDNGFKSGIKGATTSLSGFKKNTEGATASLKKMGTQNDSVGKSLTSMAKKVVGVVAAYAGFRKIVSVLQECVTKANEAEQANVRLNTIMSQIPGITDEAKASVAAYCGELSKETTIGATAQKNGASQLASFQMSADSVQTLLPQLNNLAVAQYGVNVNSDQMIQSANLLGKAWSGQTGALSRAGIVMTQDQAKILKTGTDAQKTAALVDILNANFGDLAKEMANTNEGRLIRVKNAVGGIKTAVGSALLPVITSVVEYISERLPAIQSAIEGAITKIQPYLQPIADGITNVIDKVYNGVTTYVLPALQNFWDALSPIRENLTSVGDGAGSFDIVTTACQALGTALNVVSSVTRFVIDNWQILAPIVLLVVGAIKTYNLVVGITNGLQKICAVTTGLSASAMGGMTIAELAQTAATGALTVAQTALNAAFLASPIGWIVLGIAAVVAAIAVLWNKCEGFRNLVKQVFGAIVEKAKAAWEGIKASLQPVIQAITNAFKNAWELIKTIWNMVKPYFQMVWNNIKIIFSVVSTYIGGAFRTAWAIIKAIWDTVTGYFRAIWNTIAGIFSVIKNVLTGNWSEAWEGIKGIVNTWAEFFSGIWESIKSVFGAVGEWFTSTFSAAWEGIKGIFANVAGFFQGIWDTIKNMFTSIGTSIADGVSGAFKSVINAVIDFAGGLINKFIKGINTAIGVINHIPGVNIGYLEEVNLPKLANGGVIQRPGDVMVGERGPEILSLPQGATVTPLNKAGGKTENTFYITIDAKDRSVGEIIAELIPQLKLALSNL